MDYVPGELLVRFAYDVSVSSVLLLNHQVGASVLRGYEIVDNLTHIKLPPGLTVERAVELYESDPNVLYAEPNYIYHVLPHVHATIPNDPHFDLLWGLDKIDAPRAWDVTTGDSSVVVFVLDTGGDYDHEDLAANRWPGIGHNAIKSSGDPWDDHGHGTHVSGIIGAVGNNELGVVGVNWTVTLAWAKFLDQAGTGTTSDAVKCLQYILDLKVNHGVNVVATNNSWGGSGYSQALLDAIVAHREHGILFIAAAGNDGRDNDRTPKYPASYREPGVLAVAASTEADLLAAFSNYGHRTVHLAAPGEAVYSTRPDDNYGYMQGTSAATPFATGVVALLAAQDPSRDWRALRNLILSGGDAIDAADGTTITGRRLNAAGSMACDGTHVEAVLRPLGSTLSAQPGDEILLEYLSVQCADPVGPVEVVVTGPISKTIALRDDGVTPDLAAGDGTFASTWTLPLNRYGVYTLIFPNGEGVTVSVEGGPGPAAGCGVGLYNQASATLYLKNDLSAGAADETLSMGDLGNSWLPVAGDWTVAGVYGVGLYDQQSGTFFIKHDTTPGPADDVFRYGPRGNDWLPVAGDWTGDGVYGVGLYDQQSGTFFIKDDTTPGPADDVFRYGPRDNDWLPVAGDWTGDGVYGVGLYDQQSGTFFIKHDTTPGPADMTFRYGPRGNDWLPVAGDWTGDGVHGVGLYDQQSGTFFIKYDMAPGPADMTFRYGPRDNDWLPVAGDWTGGEAGPSQVIVGSLVERPGLVVLNAPNPVTAGVTTFVAQGLNVDRIHVQVFDVSGRMVWQDQAGGSTLAWHTQDRAGRPLANGVYLYTVNALVDGQWVSSGIQRLLIVR